MLEKIVKVLDELRASEQILIISHVQPDGDALGAMAGMAHLLLRMGKRVVHYNVSRVPKNFTSLDLGAPWVQSLAELKEVLPDFTPDLLLALDCGDANRAGSEMAPLFASMRSVNIDHHMDNPLFGSVANWVEPHIPAASQMVGTLIRAAGFELSGILGECVYLGLNADTGSFRYDSTVPESFEMAADIVRNGLRLGAFFTRYEKYWSLNRLTLWGALMQNVQLAANGRVALAVVSRETLDRHQAGRGDLEGFVSFLHCLQGVDVTLLVRENGPGRSKASFRAVDVVDVRVMAAEFGGGGHKNAAGAEVPGDPDEAARAVLDVVSRHLALQQERV